MKKIFLLFVMLICGISINAQVTVSEPEFADETLLLTSNGQGVLLKRENGTVKTKAGASLYLVGIGKVKSRLTLAGVHSASTIKGAATTRLIIRAKDNTQIQTLLLVFLSLMLPRRNVGINLQNLVRCLRLRQTIFLV